MTHYSPPYSLEQPNGYYIYYDQENNIRRLLDSEGKNFLKKDFRYVELLHHANVFVCRLPGSSVIYDVMRKETTEVPYEFIKIDKFGHKMYSDNQTNFGLLDEYYEPVTTIIRGHFMDGVAPGLLKYYQDNNWHLINGRGNYIMDGLLWLSPCPINDKTLVRFTDKTFALIDSRGIIATRLPYQDVRINAPYNEVNEDTRPKYYIAGIETGEFLQGTQEPKMIFTILDGEGRAMFEPCYDYITCFRPDDPDTFMVGMGDIQDWAYLTSEPSDTSPVLTGNMRYGVINAQNLVIIPMNYSSISRSLSMPFYRVGQQGRVKVIDGNEYDYHYDEDDQYWDWEIEGERFGLLSLDGQSMLPVEYSFLSSTLKNNGQIDYYTAIRNEGDAPLYLDPDGKPMATPPEALT